MQEMGMKLGSEVQEFTRWDVGNNKCQGSDGQNK